MRRHILAWLAGYCVLSIHPTGHRTTAFAQDAPQADFIAIEDFADTPVDSLPRGWRWRGKDDDKPKLYAVRETNGRHYLAAQDTGHLSDYDNWSKTSLVDHIISFKKPMTGKLMRIPTNTPSVSPRL